MPFRLTIDVSAQQLPGAKLATTRPPLKSGTTVIAWLTSAFHAVVPSLVMACTVELSQENANTSATPFELGTAGTIELTHPVPGLDHSTVPRGSAPSETVTSADAPPAVTVTCPAAS